MKAFRQVRVVLAAAAAVLTMFVALPSSAVTQTGAPWGLDRIDQRALPLDGAYTYDATGAGVNVYVIGTGIRRTHTQFNGRSIPGFDSVGDGRNGDDCNGHSTHVAGTAGGSTYGVAKGVRLGSVRVLSCFFTANAGTHRGCLRGPAGTDFDVALYRWIGSTWGRVASGTGSTSNEDVSYPGGSGYYYWRVYSYSGAGSYTFEMQRP